MNQTKNTYQIYIDLVTKPTIQTALSIHTLFSENNSLSQNELVLMTGCEHDIILVIGPSTERILRSNPNIVSNLRKNQIWLYLQNFMNLSVAIQSSNTGDHFLELSLHDVDSFWETANDEYYAQNKGNAISIYKIHQIH